VLGIKGVLFNEISIVGSFLWVFCWKIENNEKKISIDAWK